MDRSWRRIAIGGLVFGVSALVVPGSRAVDHHVAPGGNDAAASGTADAPWRTIAAALDAAQPGDTVILHNGTYREAVRIRQPNITLMSAVNEWAVIETGFGTADSAEICMTLDVDSSGSTLRRLELVGGYYAVKFQTRWDWGGADRGGASDILIEDCIIHDSGRDCIKIQPNCDRVTIRRCEIFNSGQLYPPGTPFDNKNAEGIDSTNGDNMVVQDCYIHDIATTGVYFKGGATDCIVERSRIIRCGHGGVLLGFDTSPEFFDLDVNPRYFECIRGTVRNCIIEDTNYEGIGFFAANGALAANNTLVNTARVGHSPIYFGLTLQDWVPEAGRPASVNVQVRNNIVAQLDPIDEPMVFIRHLFEPELGNLSALDGMPMMDNNLYFSASGKLRFADARPTSALDDADLAAWRMHIGGEAASVVADPLLSDDRHLTDKSPAIAGGATLAEVSYDVDGEARTAAFDIGADQFGLNVPIAVPPVNDRPAAPSNPSQPPSDGPVDQLPPGAGVDVGEFDAAIEGEAQALSGLCPATAMLGMTLSLVGLWATGRSRKGIGGGM